MGWVSSRWVHWVVAHSAALLKRYGTLYIFCNIPCEHCHKPFEVVVKNSFRGWCLLRFNVLGHANYPPLTTQTCALCRLFCVLFCAYVFHVWPLL